MKKMTKIINKYKLKNLKIIFISKEHKLYDGCFEPGIITIYLGNHNSHKDLQDTILHELAHCILHKKHKPYYNHTPSFYRIMAELSDIS